MTLNNEDGWYSYLRETIETIFQAGDTVSQEIVDFIQSNVSIYIHTRMFFFFKSRASNLSLPFCLISNLAIRTSISPERRKNTMNNPIVLKKATKYDIAN